MKRFFSLICLAILFFVACGEEEPSKELVEREAVLHYEDEDEEEFGKIEEVSLSEEAKMEFYDFYDDIKEAGEKIEPPRRGSSVDLSYSLGIRTTDMDKTLSLTKPEDGKVYVSRGGLVNETLYYQVEEDGSWYQDLIDFVEKNKK